MLMIVLGMGDLYEDEKKCENVRRSALEIGLPSLVSKL